MSDVPSERQRLPSVELAVGAELNECSLAAAEAYRKAHHYFDDPARVTSRDLYFVHPATGVPARETLDFVRVLPGIELSDERPVDLVLLRTDSLGEEVIYLAALVREQLAFPVTSFRLNPHVPCRYVQIGKDEMLNPLITPEQEAVRAAEVNAVKAIVSLHPDTAEYLPLLSTEPDIDQIDALIGHLNTVPLRARRGLFSAAAVEAIYQRAVLRQAGYGEAGEANRATVELGDRTDEVSPVLRHHVERARGFAAQLSRLPLSHFKLRKLVGARDPVARDVMLREALHQRGVNRTKVASAGVEAVQLLAHLKLRDDIDVVVGKYDPRIESILRISFAMGHLFIAGNDLIIKDFQYANTTADTRITAFPRLDHEEIVNGTRNKLTLHVSAQPLALSAHDRVFIGHYDLDMIGKNELPRGQLEDIAFIMESMRPRVQQAAQRAAQVRGHRFSTLD